MAGGLDCIHQAHLKFLEVVAEMVLTSLKDLERIAWNPLEQQIGIDPRNIFVAPYNVEREDFEAPKRYRVDVICMRPFMNS